METDILRTETLLELIFCAEHKDKEDEIIDEVLHAYLRKLNCFMTGIIKKTNNELVEKQILPYTFRKDSTWHYLKDYINEPKNICKKGFCEILRGEYFYYVYSLSNYGFLIIGRKSAFDNIFKNEFCFVVNLLDKILSQSIEDERRKEVEKKLVDERRLLRTIIDNIPINIYTKDLKYRKTLANVSEVKHIGKNSESEVIGKTDTELYDESIGKNTLIEDKKVLIDGELILAEERNVTKNRWALVSKLPIKDDDGSITGMVGISVDFTEQKKSQDQLLLFLNLLDNSSDAVQVTLETGQLFYVNKTASERLGINPTEAKNYSVTDYIDSFKTLEDWKNHVAELKETNFLTIEGININQKTGKEFPVEVQVKYVDVNGTGYIIANSRDISERKLAENSLKESENRFRLLADNSPVLIWTSGIDTLCDYFNQTWLDFTGRSLENEMGNGWADGVHPDDLQHCLDIYIDSFNKRQKFRMEYRLKHADGQYHWLLDIGIPRFTPDGTFIGFIGSCVDITEIKNVEKTLRYQTMALDQSPVSIVMTNLDGAIEYANPKACETSGYSLEELLGNNPRVLKSGVTTTTDYDKLWKSITQNKTWKGVFHNKRKNGEFYWESAEVAPILDEKGKITSYLAIKEDITIRKKMEDALRENEEKYRIIFLQNPQPMWIYDLDTLAFLEVNQAAINHYGYTKEEFLNMTLKDIRPLEDLADFYRLIDKAKSEESTFEESRHIKKNGEIINVELTAHSIQFNTRIARHILINDITRHKQAEETIRQQIKLQDILIRISMVYININLDKVEEIIQNSLKELAEFVGADRAYIFDYDFTDNTTSNTYEWCAEEILPEIDLLQKMPLEKLPYFYGKHKNGEELCINDVYELTDKSPGSIRDALESQGIKSLISIPMMASGKLTGFVGFDSIKITHIYTDKEKKLLEVFSQMLVNITERKRSETLLVLQEEKYRNIISNMNLGIIEVDKNENIIYANQSFSSISGYTVEELLTMNTSEFLSSPNENNVLAEKLKLRENGISDSYELYVKNKKGEQRCWLISGAPNYNDDHELQGSIGIHLDITEQKKMEKDLELALKNAEQAVQAKEAFLANMSHEIRTPLNVITGMVRELSKEELTEKQRKYIKHSETSTQHLLTIVNNILDMSKINAGEFDLDTKNFSISAVAADVKSIMYSRAKDKNLEFRVNLSEEIKRSHLGDPGRLRQILINLLSNSFKFTDSGYIELNFNVLNTNEKSQIILFEVVDTGIGMTEEFVNKLFDKFSQEVSTANRRLEGTGLGMSITKELVQLMGGTINVESKKGSGTQIRFELELPIGDESKLLVKTTKIGKNSFEGVKILLVEDNEMNRFIAIQSLKFIGCEITEAVNGLDAIEKINNEKFDIILMDIQMPEMDGIEATKHIRENCDDQIPIIALTANAFKHDIDLYLSIGMNDFLIKPYKEEDLYRIIDKFTQSAIIKISKLDQIKKSKFIDIEQLNELSRGDDEFIIKILHFFVELANQSIIDLNNSYDKRDLVTIHKVAHKIKPSIDNLGIISLKEKIRKLEVFNTGEESDFELKNLIEEVIDILRLVIKEIE